MVTSCADDDNMKNNITETSYAKVVGDESIVEVTTVKSEINSRIIEMKITNKKTKVTLPTIYHKITLDNKNEKFDDLSKDLSSINGIYTIEVNGQILVSKIIKNGKIQSTEIKTASSLYARYPCTTRGLILCADNEFNNMNWVEYGFCMAGAPACLAEVYASCAWESCN